MKRTLVFALIAFMLTACGSQPAATQTQTLTPAEVQTVLRCDSALKPHGMTIWVQIGGNLSAIPTCRGAALWLTGEAQSATQAIYTALTNAYARPGQTEIDNLKAAVATYHAYAARVG